jgi:DNA helicase II / ATP-dependent DNA helicase PcrA
VTPEDLRTLIGIDFSTQQMDAITAPLRPGVIIAGAGTGKTMVMAARVVWLVGRGDVRPDEVLGLTFTNKAAAELGHRIRSSLDQAGFLRRPQPGYESEEPGEPFTATYHAYAARLLTAHGLRIGHEPDTRLVADATRYQLALQVLRSHRDPITSLTSDIRTLVTYLLQLDAQLCDHLVTTDAVRAWQHRERQAWFSAPRMTLKIKEVLDTLDERQELIALVDEYRALKTAKGVMDFSDQMSRAALLAEGHPVVGEQERATYKIVMLDEYQDTSVAQARMLKGLFSGRDVARGLGHPVTAVGDPFQAIYGWRGASASNIHTFASDFPAADGLVTTYPLSINRRSVRHVLDVANDLIAPLRADVDGSEPLHAPPGTARGSIRGGIYETYGDEIADIAPRVQAAYHAMPRGSWSDIAILIRDNKTAAAVHATLAAAGIPVEVVGLSGLLSMPEVAEVVSTLQLTYDVTSNAALLQLLTGPRWAIGARDLAILGRRARDLARGFDAQPAVVDGAEVSVDLEEAVAGVDPADVLSLLEALERPGGPERYPYSDEARERFAMLADELAMLRRYIGEPLLDLVRRVIDVSGIDVELAASNAPVAVSRRDNLSGFVEAVAAFAGTDQDASLPGLLAYLAAEDEYGNGLPLALPSESNSVKLMTIFRAKGLEWDVVFLPTWSKGTFPPVRRRSRWTSAPAELPWPLRGDYDDLPHIREYSSKGLETFVADCQEHAVAEERRLAYVAVTRPRQLLDVSCYYWGPTQKDVRGPSVFMTEYQECAARLGASVVEHAPAPTATINPQLTERARHAWPVEADPTEVARRIEARDLVREAEVVGWERAAALATEELGIDELATVRDWDLDIDRLVAEAQAAAAAVVEVPIPAALSATLLERLRDDPGGLARDLARPTPRRPVRAARFGTRFHAWVEGYLGQQGLLEPDDLPGSADDGIADDAELTELIEAFKMGPFATRSPVQVEAPFSLVLAGQLVRGRIDAVYRESDGYLVVDWKTNQGATSDPLQLAIYRVALSELMGVPVESVLAAFYYVRTGAVVFHDDLPDRSDLERLVTMR